MHWMELINNSEGKYSFTTTRKALRKERTGKPGKRTKLYWKLILWDVTMALHGVKELPS